MSVSGTPSAYKKAAASPDGDGHPFPKWASPAHVAHADCEPGAKPPRKPRPPPARGRNLGDSARRPTIQGMPWMAGHHENWGIFKCHKWKKWRRHSKIGPPILANRWWLSPARRTPRCGARRYPSARVRPARLPTVGYGVLIDRRLLLVFIALRGDARSWRRQSDRTLPDSSVTSDLRRGAVD